MDDKKIIEEVKEEPTVEPKKAEPKKDSKKASRKKFLARKLHAINQMEDRAKAREVYTSLMSIK